MFVLVSMKGSNMEVRSGLIPDYVTGTAKCGTLHLYQYSFARNFRLQFSVGVANRQFLGRGGRSGVGMAPFERALVSSYRPSIVTFPLSLRVSEISPLLFYSMPLFPYPISNLPKIPACSPGTESRWIAFWLQIAKVLS